MSAPAPIVKTGENIPEATFQYVPWSDDLEDNSFCGLAISLKTSDWKGKRVLVVAVPGAFTRTCHGQIPGYHKLEKEFKAKGIDEIAVLATNDAFVQSGWGRFMGIKDELIFISDTLGKFSVALGLANDKGTGIRAARYVLLISREGTVEKLLVEPGAGVTLTAAESVLAGL